MLKKLFGALQGTRKKPEPEAVAATPPPYRLTLNFDRRVIDRSLHLSSPELESVVASLVSVLSGKPINAPWGIFWFERSHLVNWSITPTVAPEELQKVIAVVERKFTTGDTHFGTVSATQS